jgi:hypothetical protein
MLKEIRRIESRARANYIRLLQRREKIKTHINAKGYICYDTEELKTLQKNTKKGRPSKILKQGE